MTRSSLPNDELLWLKQHYFAQPHKIVRLAKGETLLEQGEPNRRLFLVCQGGLFAYLHGEDGEEIELFHARPDTFVGVTSFFSRRYVSYTTLVADDETTLAYIDAEQEWIPDPSQKSFVEQFLPVIMDDLHQRQLLMQEAAAQRQKALSRLLQREKMAMLGELSAGIAHELNNAISVLARRSQWLADELARYFLSHEAGTPAALFQRGLVEGRSFSSEERRRRRRSLESHRSCSPARARRWAETGLEETEILQLLGEKDADAWPLFWELGAALHDMHTASRHTVHVVNAIKQLGVTTHQREEKAPIQETIEEALVLLQNVLGEIEVELSSPQEALPQVWCRRGDLIQVWLNLLKNACESMFDAGVARPTLRIDSGQKGERIFVSITDNGPGIPKDLRRRIFEPHFTTKTHGASVGLGLGLAIVQRIVDNAEGELVVTSRPGHTTFTVQLPVP